MEDDRGRPQPVLGPQEMESAMQTGSGADDEPAMTIEDKYGGADEAAESDSDALARAAEALGAEPPEQADEGRP